MAHRQQTPRSCGLVQERRMCQLPGQTVRKLVFFRSILPPPTLKPGLLVGQFPARAATLSWPSFVTASLLPPVSSCSFFSCVVYCLSITVPVSMTMLSGLQNRRAFQSLRSYVQDDRLQHYKGMLDASAGVWMCVWCGCVGV